MQQALPKDVPKQCPTPSPSPSISKEVSLSHSPHPDESDSDSEKQGPTTQAGEVCKALKRLGMSSVSPSHPELIAMLKKGVTIAMFEDAATKTVAKSKGFAYMLAILANQLQSAAAIEAGPSAVAAPEVPDAAETTLRELEKRSQGAAPIPANLREKFAGITGKLTGAMQ